jgi:purine-binding chemotaxis protein CheW
MQARPRIDWLPRRPSLKDRKTFSMSAVLDHVQHGEMISFQVAGQEFCIEIGTVREIRGWTAATPLPHSPHHIRGVINLRGAVMPVVDLGARLGFGLTRASERHVIIVAVVAGRQVGLLVDAVCETINTAHDQFQPAPDFADDGAGGLVRGLLPFEGRMISLLAIEKAVLG